MCGNEWDLLHNDVNAGIAPLEFRNQIGDDFAFAPEAPEDDAFSRVARLRCATGEYRMHNAECRNQGEFPPSAFCLMRSHLSQPPLNPARFSPLTICGFFRIVFQTSPLR